MYHHRRWLAMLFAFIMLFGLGACGKTETKTAGRSEIVNDPFETPTDKNNNYITDPSGTEYAPDRPENNGESTEPEADSGNAEMPSTPGNSSTPSSNGNSGSSPQNGNSTPSTETSDSDDSSAEIPAELNGPNTVWLSAYDQNAKSRPISAVKWWKNETDDIHYFFLPAALAKGDLQIWIQGDFVCSVNDAAYTNGDRVKKLANGVYNFGFGGSDYIVKVMRSANIGSMFISTESGNLDYIHAQKGNEERGRMMMLDAGGKVVYNDALTEMKGRGNATWKRAKKGYQIKLDKKTDLIGNAGKAKTWILLANYLERTMFRNAFAYDLAYQSGLTESSLSTYVDLYCNGEYRGTYQVTEKVQIGENRVDIQDLEKATEAVNSQKLDSYPTFGGGSADGSRKGFEIPNNPKDITGGYLLELDYKDRYAEEASGFVTTRGQAVSIKEPECASRAQVDYIANYFQEFEDACFAEDGKCPSTGKYYYEYFDLTSLARKYIVEEITKNIDADVTSQYFYKPSDSESKVGFCGPVWDYDNSMANHGDKNALSADGLYAAHRKKYIFHNLYKKDSFLTAVKTEWNKTFKPLLTTCVSKSNSASGSTLKTITEYSKLLTPSAAMNFTRWDNIDKVDGDAYNNTGSTYPEHVNFLRTFLKERLAFLNKEWK